MKNKILITSIAVFAIINVSSFLIYLTMQEKRYFVATTALEPVEVTRKVKELGYKVIGRDKLFKPNPYVLTDEDLEFLSDRLPEWLNENYPAIEIGVKRIDKNELKKKLKYEFTLLYYQDKLDGDFYTLKITNGKETRIVYIGKGCIANEHLNGVDYVIELYNEAWHENYSNPKPFNPETDFW